MAKEVNSNSEDNLYEIIIEYLDFYKFHQTKENFATELKEKGKTLPKLKTLSSVADSKELQEKLFQAFHRGDKSEFFDLWNENLPAQLRSSDTVCQKLEFYCQVYFAIYPSIKYGNGSTGDSLDIETTTTVAMSGFREYLEAKGRVVTSTMGQEFVQYYALPFVTAPREHPSFRELFHENWVLGLETRLKRFFPLVFGEGHHEPSLLEIFRRYNQKRSSSDENSLKILQTKVVEAERRATQYYKKLNQVQINFHSLLGITAELIDLLEGSLQGIPISPNHLKNICQKIFVSQNQKTKSNGMPLEASFDLSRPGTASKLLLQSIHVSNGSIPGNNNQTLPFEPVLLNNPIKTYPLNFKKLKFDLRHGNLRIKVLLLQAFRWRLTKTDVDSRNRFISSAIQHDLLGIEPGEYHDSIFQMMNSSLGSLELQEYLARFINAVATLCKGRSYLVKTSSICELLFLNILSHTHKESIFRESLIGALQKLSLRRFIQTYMITNGMIEWLLSLLEENTTISDYTLDYSVALLMNLCLRTSGKKRCIEERTRIIKVLSTMLDSFNKEIASYVNGAFYSILSIPEIREEAIKMNLEATLRNHMKPEQPDMNRQFEYIINQLNSNDGPKLEESDDEEEDDDEEDPEILESELDKDESVIPLGNELVGEELLNTNYILQPDHSSPDLQSSNPTISRPVTPGTFLARRSSALGDVETKVRPPTRSGSVIKEETTSENRKSSPPKQDPTKENTNYKKAFSSRPKIPRTPDEENLKRTNQYSLTGPIPSSGRLPTPSGSNGARRGKESMSTTK